MRLYPSTAAAASLLMVVPPPSEAKLGAPLHRRSLESSCYEHPGQFRYQTQTNGSILISCSRLVKQMARGAVSASNMSNKCIQPLVGDYRYGPGATVADACPALCGRPCDDQDDDAATFEEQDSPDLMDEVAAVVDSHDEEDNNTDGDGGDVIRLPENDRNEDVIIEDEPVIELIEPDEESVHEEQQQQAAAEEPQESSGIIETIQSQIQQELTESEDEEYGDTTPTIDLIAESEDDENETEQEDEVDTQIDRPTPTIASFGKFVFRNFIICQQALFNCSLHFLPSNTTHTLQNQSNVETANGEMTSTWS